MKTENILNHHVSTKSAAECIGHIRQMLYSGENKMVFVCANPHSIQVSQSDRLFDKALKNADLVVPDGIGIVLASKILGGGVRERVTGSDIFLGLSNELNKTGSKSYYFLGSDEETLAKIKSRMALDFSQIEFAGFYSPPFKDEFTEEDNRLMIEAINKARPDVLWVGMTAPKQEKWIYLNKDKLDVKFIGAIGAVFDFYAGTKKRSHPFFQKIGLEWLPRLLREPKRLWYRNFVSNPSFLLRVLRQRFMGKG